MKFHEVDAAQWPELKPYLDTCLLPVTGLTGSEEPLAVTQALERLQDALDMIEAPYKGRVVTYPTLHYITGVNANEQAEALAEQIKASGFKHVIVLTLLTEAVEWETVHIDLLIALDWAQWANEAELVKSSISQHIQRLWYPVD
ncbi:DUF2487 family protein [Paenibacillus oryzisoli]|uniref:DUF2487 family protein n=1 Tax=Paenibacillus oryzisoli TaxID=1850517 RepID=UPI003D2CE73D